MSIKNILTLIINHHYFRDDRCRNFLIRPDTLTENFLKKNRVAVRYIYNSWQLFTDIEKDSLWLPVEFDSDKISLKFILSSSDENFYQSVYDPNFKTGITCMCNEKGNLELQACSCTDTTCINYSKQISGKMNWVICLYFDRSSFLDSNKIFTVTFKVKEVYWKYYIFGCNEHDALGIIDTDSDINFLPEKKETFPYDKTALTFVSDKKMPLTENDSHNFRLIANKGGIVRNLIKRLPVATPSGVQFKDSSKKDFVSLIFINT